LDRVTTPTIPTYDDIRRAADGISGRVRRTPVLEVEVGGRPVSLKLELLQHTGSFKVRGAFTSVLSAAEPPTTLVAASGGNHGLAVAYVGHALGLATHVFVPQGAPAVKVAAIAALGAEVSQAGATYADALEASREAAARPGVLALHAYDAVGTVTGQGTLGLELADQVPDVDTVLVAVGGGGLMAGVTAALAGAAPQARVVAVEPERCPTLHSALAQGAPVQVEVGGVAADSLGASRIGSIAYDVALDREVTPVLVSDDDIVAARRWLWREARLAAEPGGAAALAALLAGAHVPAEGERVCVIVCGANADPADLG
jgi:threonine dehydratase